MRLDDLDAGYSFKELDRSVFMNPDKVNARIVIPITEYKDVVAKHDVDMFLYANNYEEDGESLRFIDNVEDTLKVYRADIHMANLDLYKDKINVNHYYKIISNVCLIKGLRLDNYVLV